MRIGGPLSRTLFLSALLSVGLPWLAAAAGSVGADRPVVGAPLRAVLARDGVARVVVALHDPVRRFSTIASRVAAASAVKARALAAVEGTGFRIVDDWSALHAVSAIASAEAVERLAALAEVARIDLDAPGSGHLGESVPLVRAGAVHGRGFTGRGVRVAVLDSGQDLTHPDLSDDLLVQQCYCRNFDGTGCCPSGATEQSGNGSARDDHGHGTNVTGIVTGGGRIASIGVAPDAKIVAVRVLDASNRFSGSSQVVSGMNWILVNRPDVRMVNMSLGTDARFMGDCDSAAAFTMAMAEAANALNARGTVLFASSGNEASNNAISAPACLSSVMSVGAVYDSALGTQTLLGCTDSATAADFVTCFTNRNAHLDLLAPGALVSSAGRGGGISTFAGTSQASPHAAGLAALLLEARPTLSPGEIEAALKSTGRLVSDAASGVAFPRLDALAALDSVQPGAPSVCLPSAANLCLNGSRFRVSVEWRAINQGTSGDGQAVPLTGDTGYFWFFNAANVETVVKVLDGRAINGSFWVFYGALSDVEYTITVEDTATGARKTYFNPQNRLASVADTSAF